MQKMDMLRKAMLAGVLALAVASPALADTFVQGHFRHDGTYVAPHYRSNPDSSFQNNWSTQPNVNPYTGQPGTRMYPSQPLPSYRPYSSPTFPNRSSQDYGFGR